MSGLLVAYSISFFLRSSSLYDLANSKILSAYIGHF